MWQVYFYFFLLFLSLGVWIIKYPYLRTELKILGIVFIFNLLFEGYAAYLMFNNTRNLFLFHILTPIQYVIYSYIYYKALSDILIKKIIILSIPFYLMVTLLITLYIQTTNDFNSYALLLKNILIPCWVLFYFREVFIKLNIPKLEMEPLFWVSTGLLFYSFGNFFVDGLMNYLINETPGWAQKLYYISIFLGFSLYITFIIAIALERKVKVI